MAIDPTQFLPLVFGQPQSSSYPTGLAGALSEGLGKFLIAETLAPHLRSRFQQDEDVRQRQREMLLQILESQRRQLEREPLESRYRFLLDLHKNDPRGAFNAAYTDDPDFRELVAKLQGYRAPQVPITTQVPIQRMEEGGLSQFLAPAGQQQVQTGTEFRLPGGAAQGFRTIADMAAALGLMLQPNVNPNLMVDDLRRQGIDLNSLLINPREEAQAALDRLVRTYGRQVWTNPVLKQKFLEAYQAATGEAFPTERAAGMQTVQPPIRGTGPGLATIGTQQPIGPVIDRPILPQVEGQITVDLPGVGRVPLSSLPEGAQTAVITRMLDRQAKVEVTLSNGQKVLVSPEKALDMDLARGSQVTFKDPVTGAVVTVPATSLPSFFPRRAPGGGGQASTEGLTPAQKRVVDTYNRFVDQRFRLQQTIAQGVADEATQRRLQSDVEDLDRRIGELQPQVDKILGLRGQPAPTGALSQETIGYIHAAAKRTPPVPIDQVLTWARQNGLNEKAVRAEYDTARGVVKPQPSMQGMAKFVASLNQRRLNWAQARVLIIRELTRRGFAAADAARIADQKRTTPRNWSP